MSGNDAKRFLEKPVGREKRDLIEEIVEECIKEACDPEEIFEYFEGNYLHANGVYFFPLLYGMKTFYSFFFHLDARVNPTTSG